MDAFDRLAALIRDTVEPGEREDATVLVDAGMAFVRLIEQMGADLDRIATALEKGK